MAHHYAISGTLSPGYLEKFAFLLQHCIKQNAQHEWFYVNQYIFAKICAKNDLHISTPNDLALWPSNLKIALPVIPYGVNFPQSFNILQFSIFELMLGTGQMDEQTGRWV